MILVFLEGRLGRPEVPLKTRYIPCVSGGAPRAPRGASQNPLYSLCFWRGASGAPRRLSKTLYNPCVSGGAPRAPRGTSQKPLYSLCFWRGASGAPTCLSKTFIILVFLEGRLGRPEVPLKNLYNPCVSGGAPLNPIKTYQKSMETYGNQAKSG